MAEDELCSIIYCMVKHDQRNALWKSERTPTDLILQELVDYFEQIKLIDGVKQSQKQLLLMTILTKRKSQAVIARKMQTVTRRLRATSQKVLINLIGLGQP
eukprot:10115632-Ditylum_brightwellii.AAC.1